MDSLLNDPNIVSKIVTGIGLLLDIIGVIFLFISTKTKKIEAEFSHNIISHTLSRTIEWSQEWEDANEAMPRLRKKIERNRKFTTTGLILIIIGFILQFFAILVPDIYS